MHARHVFTLADSLNTLAGGGGGGGLFLLHNRVHLAAHFGRNTSVSGGLRLDNTTYKVDNRAIALSCHISLTFFRRKSNKVGDTRISQNVVCVTSHIYIKGVWGKGADTPF